MNTLFTDIDNTIIYSRNRDINGEKIVVEYLNGREQGYMTVFSYNYFLNAKWLNIIPVTSRTEQQYNRLSCMKDFGVKFAIICNGGKLLVDGKEDKDWSEDNLRMTELYSSDLDFATDYLFHVCGKNTVHDPEPYMRYVKVDNPLQIYGLISKKLQNRAVETWYDSRKVYLFIKGINKGNAIRKVIKRYDMGSTIAAGDDYMDVSMLNAVDYAIYATRLDSLIDNRNRRAMRGKIISDNICDELEKIRLNI